MNKTNKIISVILCISIIFSICYSPVAYAGTSEWNDPVVQINNGVIRVTADKQSGRFIAETLSGIPNKSSDDNQDLLYGNRFQSPETSYTTVRIDGEDFIFGNSYDFMGLNGHYTTAPYVETDTNSIVSEWAVKGVTIKQRLTLMTNPKLPSIGNVYVSYEIINKSSNSKNVGLRMLLDTKIGLVDCPALTIPGQGFIYKESEFRGDEIPTIWYAYNQYISPEIIAVGAVSGEGLSKPDKLQFAAWGDVSQTKWDYTIDRNKSIIQVLVDNLPYDGPNGIYPENSTVDYAVKDSCAVMYWNPEEVKQGESLTIDTAYGVGDASSAGDAASYRISLQGTDKLNMKQDKSGYTTEFVSAEFNIDNNFDNSTNISSAQIELELPDELTLVDGEQKTVISSLTKGSYHRSIWKIRPKVQENYTVSAYSVIFRAEGKVTQRITKILIMEGSVGGLPNIAFLDYAPKTPFYVYDKSRTVSVNGSGFDVFGSAINQIMEAKLIKGSQSFNIDPKTLISSSDNVFSLSIPDGIPLGTYDLFVSVADATGNNKDMKTFKSAVVISEDIQYSHNLVNSIQFPIVMKEDGINTPEEYITIHGIFIDNKDGTYTSLGAEYKNPVIINNTLNYSGGTLLVNTNPLQASLISNNGLLWCEIIDQNSKAVTQTIIAKSGFRFEADGEIGDEDTKVRMVYDLEKPGVNSTTDVSYKNMPITIHKVILTQTGIDINGSMGILNPLTYLTNSVVPNEDVDKLIGELGGIGYFQAELGNISLDQDGMNIDGRFSFVMPFALSLVSGTDAVLEINTKEEHIVVELGVSIGNMLPVSAGAKSRVGFRRGRIDEFYIKESFPEAIPVAPPIPFGIAGVSGGLNNLSFKGALPLTMVLGLSLSDTTGLDFQSYNLLSVDGEAEVSAFHYQSNASAAVYMMDIAEVNQRYVWWTLDPNIEKRGIRIEGTILYYVFEGKVYVSYFEGEGFIGKANLNVVVPKLVPVIGGLVLAGVGAEITEYSIAGSAYVLNLDIGIRYYFYTNKVEFLEMKEELESSRNGIEIEYGDGFIAEYGYNFIPVDTTQYADENLNYITELNLTNNSNVMLVLKMTEEQFNKLDEDSIKIIRPGTGGILKVKYINNTDLIDAEGKIVNIEAEQNEIIGVKQIIDNSADGMANEYMVTVPMASPEDGQWTIITNGSMEVLPYSSMQNPEIVSLTSEYNSDGTITSKWVLDKEPDKFRLYIVNSDNVSEDELHNPASLWGKGNLLYGQTVTTKDYTVPSTNEKMQLENEIIYTTPTKDGEVGTYTTEKLNLPTGTYFIYAKADKENTVAAYEVCQISIANPATPDSPKNFLVEDIGNNSIKLSWDADYSVSRYFIYRKNSSDEKYDTGSPFAVYEVDKSGEMLDRFEIVIPGDEVDKGNPTSKSYYFDIRAVGKKPQLLTSLNAISINNDETIGLPASGFVKMSVPEEITVYSELRSSDDKIYQKPFVEKDNDGIEHLYYMYVTKSKNTLINCSSEHPVKYKITQNGTGLPSSHSGYVTDFSEKLTLSDGINYFIITYENEGGDTLVEEYVAELDNKAPSLVVLEPVEGKVAVNGKINVSGVTEPFAVVSVNNLNYESDYNGNFTAEINLGTSFISEITIEVRDTAGNVASKKISVLNDMAKISDITLIPEYKITTTGMSQQLSTYVSENDVLGEKLPSNLVKYSITQGSDLAAVNADGILTAKYAGTIIIKAEVFVTDNASLSDSIAVEISGDKKPGPSRYYPPVYSKEELTWLAGSSMSTSGGIIKTVDGVELNVPKGAVPYFQENVDIYVYNDIPGILSNMKIPSGASAASSPYYISLLTDFKVPAQLTLPVNGFDKAYIYYFDENIKALIYKGGEMSSDKTRVTAHITKPGTYIALNYPSQTIFADVAADFWGYDYIYGLNYLDIINGYEAGGKTIFKTDSYIKRSEFIKLLVMAYNINLGDAEGIELKFADNENIPPWAVPYVKAAVMKGLVNGKNIDGKNFFAADDFITREEIAAMIGRSLEEVKAGSKPFNDSSFISSWSREEIMKLVELGIITGYEDNTFRPKNNATRTETAVLIYKYLMLFK